MFCWQKLNLSLFTSVLVVQRVSSSSPRPRLRESSTKQRPDTGRFCVQFYMYVLSEPHCKELLLWSVWKTWRQNFSIRRCFLLQTLCNDKKKNRILKVFKWDKLRIELDTSLPCLHPEWKHVWCLTHWAASVFTLKPLLSGLNSQIHNLHWDHFTIRLPL